VDYSNLVNAGGRRIHFYVDKAQSADGIYNEIKGSLVERGFLDDINGQLLPIENHHVFRNGVVARYFYSFNGDEFVDFQVENSKNGPHYVSICFGQTMDRGEEAQFRGRL
jgi:hypothetical protein